MTEQEETFEKLRVSRADELIRWVFEWDFWRVNRDYDPAAGHNQTVVGVLAFTYATDLFNRLASSGKYFLPEREAGDRGLDVLEAGIPAEAFAEMLELDRSMIRRSDFAGSPGWSVGDVRWILQSFSYGEIDKINWNDKSETKRRAGRQPYDFGNPGLFDLDDYGLESEFLDDFEGTTFVLAHAFNGETGSYEVFLGRSRAADQPGDGAWHWRKKIAAGGFGPNDPPSELNETGLPGVPPTPTAPDADVRIKGLPNRQAGSDA